MNKIAIVGTPQMSRSISAHVISDILERPFLNSPSFENIYQNIYQKKLDSKCFYSEIYTVGLSQFHSRILAEKDQYFVSDGSVLDEVVCRKLSIECKGVMSVRHDMKYILLKNKYLQFGIKIDHLVEDYFVGAYDKIYLFSNTEYCSEYSKEYEAVLKSIMDRKKISYKQIYGNEISFICEVLKDEYTREYEITQVEKVINIYKQIID